MNENRDYLELAAEAVRVFGNDGKLNEVELSRLLDIAKRDAIVDTNEVRVLTNIIGKVKSYELTTSMRQKIRDFEKTHNVSIL